MFLQLLSTDRAPLVAADKLEEECEGGLEDADHEERVQHPTRYEPFKGGQRDNVENNSFDKKLYKNMCEILKEGFTLI